MTAWCAASTTTRARPLSSRTAPSERRTQSLVADVTTVCQKLWAGRKRPGIGFAIGEDRLVMTLAEKTSAESVVRKPDVYIAPMAGMNAEAAKLARELRRHDLVIELGDDSFRLKKSFEAATKAGAKYILIVGENEVKADAFALKNLATGEQVSVARAELAARIRRNGFPTT